MYKGKLYYATRIIGYSFIATWVLLGIFDNLFNTFTALLFLALELGTVTISIIHLKKIKECIAFPITMLCISLIGIAMGLV